MKEDVDVEGCLGGEGPLLVLKDEGRLTKTKAGKPGHPASTPTPQGEKTCGAPFDADGYGIGCGLEGGLEDADEELETKVVQFSILYDGDEEKFEHLWALRDLSFRALNIAFSEWRRADKVVSKKNPEKTTLERKPVGLAVRTLADKQRAYWAAQLDTRLASVERVRVSLGRARSKNREPEIERIEKELARALSDVKKARVRAEIDFSPFVDSIVHFTMQRHAVYKKVEWSGERSADSFKADGPVRWDKPTLWDLEEGEKRGHYVLKLALGKDGNRVDRRSFDVMPDGGGMYGYAKRMLEEGAKLCDARAVWSERKSQWFAKLTVKLPRKAAKVAGTETASLRRGVKSALVLAYEDGYVRTIEGTDVLWFKRKVKARRGALGNRGRRLDCGTEARTHGRKKWLRALTRLGDAEDRFVDAKCKTWAAAIAAELVERKVGKLLVAKMEKMGGKDMSAGGDEVVEALLYAWPFARLLEWITKACEAVPVDNRGRAIRAKFDDEGKKVVGKPVSLGTGAKLVPKDPDREVAGYVKIEVGSFESVYNARRCPSCKHMHEKRQEGTFECEVCKFTRPADQIVAWNGLLDAVGGEPLEKAKKKTKATADALIKVLKEDGDDDGDDE